MQNKINYFELFKKDTSDEYIIYHSLYKVYHKYNFTLKCNYCT